MRTLLGTGTVLAGLAALVGLWFFQHESAYAGANPYSELAETLQWVGVGLALIGAAGVLFGVALLRAGVGGDSNDLRKEER